jgi:DNA repair photolyase
VALVRRLAIENPPNRFAENEVVYLEEELDEGETRPAAKLEVYFDESASVLAKNDSPDVGFSYSVNPYRGCFHGCAYCFARPTHEYLSFGAGTDFERKIVVKRDAPTLLDKAFSSKSWHHDLVMFSGVTDCYQPLESRYRLTRGCLEIAVRHRNPVHIITKSPLIERDIDVLVALSRVAHLTVAVSVPFHREEHARALEPFVTTPARRLRTIERLAAAGIRVGVSVAPVIPGLSDEDIPDILEAARKAGASFAGWVLLRLPGHVKDVFESRLRATLPDKADRVMSHVRQTRNGKLYDSTFGSRGRGQGTYAQAIGKLFANTASRLGYETPQERQEGASGMILTAIARDDVARTPVRQLSLFDG